MIVSDFLINVKNIADSKPVYRTGGSGGDGTCDCVGLIMGALKKRYDLHSSNYFARFQMRSLDALADESQLHPGSIVYKSRRDTGELNARYQAGGRYYTGDLLDYYHVGVVTSIDPLEITHCTSTNNVNGITYDASIRAWSHFGDLLDVDYSQEEAVKMAQYMAAVTASSGSTVRMRKRPDGSAPEVAKVPIGQTVVVLESAAGWAKISWNGTTGYMMAQFLRTLEPETVQTDGESVTINITKEAALAFFEALKGAGL